MIELLLWFPIIEYIKNLRSMTEICLDPPKISKRLPLSLETSQNNLILKFKQKFIKIKYYSDISPSLQVFSQMY